MANTEMCWQLKHVEAGKGNRLEEIYNQRPGQMCGRQKAEGARSATLLTPMPQQRTSREACVQAAWNKGDLRLYHVVNDQ